MYVSKHQTQGAISFRTDSISRAVVPRSVTIPPDSITGGGGGGPGSQRPLVARRGMSMGTYHCLAPEEAYGLIGVPSAECERAECIGRLVLEPLQELVET